MLSVVVPCYNEEAVVDSLVTVLKDVLPRVATSFEVLLVDDGSGDRTLERLREINADDPRFRYLALSRNFGKESAMLAGLSQARGDAVAILDADLQHPPELLAQMLPLLADGKDQVIARRTRTGDKPVRTMFSKAYYRIFNRLIDVTLEDGAGDFRVLSRRAVRALLAVGEYNRFSKGLFSWIGFDTAVVDYENVARAGGETKWSMRSLVSFNSRPLRLAIYFGAFISLVAFLYALWVLGDAIINGNQAPGYVTTICTVVGFGGVQMILLGVIGEYLGRIYLETKNRPHFLLKESSEGPDLTPVAVLLGQEHEQFITPPANEDRA